MKTKTISYTFVKNSGNYQSKRLEWTVELEDGDDPDRCHAELVKKVHEKLNRPDEQNYF
jgi:hypothetical protein